MSRFQSTRRRLSLLASSSLVAASLTAATSLGLVALTPTTAHAANECAPVGVDPAVNGQTPDSYNCDVFEYPTGITYDSAGDLSVVTDPGADPNWGIPHTEVGGEGIILNGHDDDSVIFDAMGSYITAYENTGAALTVTTVNGDISVTSTSALNSAGTHALRVTSDTGAIGVTARNIFAGIGVEASTAGDITLSIIDTYTYGGPAVLATSTGGSIAIEARSISGVSGVEATAEGDISIIGLYVFGREGDGVNATSTGDGTVDIRVIGGVGGFTGVEAATGGDIDIRVDGANGFGDYGIHAVSSGGGDVNVSANGASGPTTAVVLMSTGGNGDVTFTGRQITSDADGIYAQASGSGDLTLNLGGTVSAGDLGVEAVTGTGLLTINVGNTAGGAGVANVGAQGGAIVTRAGGEAVININTGSSLATGQSGNPALDMIGIAAGTTTTVNIGGGDAGIDPVEGPIDRRASVSGIRASGAGALVLNVDGRINSTINGNPIDFGALSGGVAFDMGDNSAWFIPNVEIGFAGGEPTPQVNRFSSGDDTITSAGRILAGVLDNEAGLSTPVVVDFGAGEDSFDNSGLIGFNLDRSNAADRTRFAGEMRFLNLESFTHSGVLLLGGMEVDRSGGQQSLGELQTDGWSDDVLSMPGTQWIGDGGEVVFDVDLNNSQTDCTTRNAGGDLPAADCIMLIGGSTEGVTYATINEIFPGDRGKHNPEGILLVDVSGAGAGGQQGDFVVGPNSTSYSSEFGGIVDKGVFFSIIAYDEEAQQHRLVSLPGVNALQFPVLSSVAQSLWRTTTGSWFDRQADLRGSPYEGVGGGVWLRLSGENATREVDQSVVGPARSFRSSTTTATRAMPSPAAPT